MTYEPRPLPETFDVTQARRMAAAHDVGDLHDRERIRRHLVTEGSSSRAETDWADQFTAAMLLAKEMVDASTVGNKTRSTGRFQGVSASHEMIMGLY